MKVSFIIPSYNSEKTILSTLDSVLAQNDVDIEVICVDDHSADDTAELIKRAASADPRIKLIVNEVNKGVSYARNAGIRAASGEYLRFIDADDLIPPGSTRLMLDVAEKNDSDLVVGIMEGRRSGRTVRFVSTAAVAEKEVIDRYDPGMTRTFSVCNKMFRTSMIREHGVEFRPYKHAEDGLFLYEFLQYARTVNGCNAVVYTYCQTTTFKRRSATNSLTEESLHGILEISESIHKMHRKAPAAFHETLDRRILSATLIEKYYRMLWTLSDNAFCLLQESISEYRKRLSGDIWQEIAAEHKDLALDKAVLDKAGAAQNAIVTIAVTDRLNKEALNDLLGSLYFQKSPLFRVICAADPMEVDISYRKMPNIGFSADKGDSFFYKAASECTSPYITFIDDPVMFTFETLMRAIRSFTDDTDYVTGICRRLKDEKISTPLLYRYCFEKDATGIEKGSSAHDRLDALVSNKIFRSEKILALMDDNDKKIPDTETLAEVMRCGRYRNIIYLLEYSDKKLREVLMNEHCRGTAILDYISTAGNKKESLDGSGRLSEKVLFVCDSAETSDSFKKLYDDLEADKELYIKAEEPELSVRLARYAAYKTVLFETFDDGIDTLPATDGQRACVLLRFFGRGKYARQIISELPERSKRNS